MVQNKIVHNTVWSLKQKLRSHFHFQGYDFIWLISMKREREKKKKRRQFDVVFDIFLFRFVYGKNTNEPKKCVSLHRQNSGHYNKSRYLHRNSTAPIRRPSHRRFAPHFVDRWQLQSGRFAFSFCYYPWWVCSSSLFQSCTSLQFANKGKPSQQ